MKVRKTSVITEKATSESTISIQFKDENLQICK